MSKQEIVTVTYRWDAPCGVTPGWYCESYDHERRMVSDSMKIWWPVDVDAYTESQESELVEALAEAFPGADIEEE